MLASLLFGAPAGPRASPSSSRAVNAAAVAAAAAAGLSAAAALVAYLYWEYPVFHHPRIKKQALLKSVSSETGTVALPKGRAPVVGDLLPLAAGFDRIHDMFSEILNENARECAERGLPPGGATMNLPFTPAMIGSVDPALVEHVLKTKFHIYNKGHFFFSRTSDVLGHGIFAVDGDEWKFQRKTAANLFNVKNFKEFVGVVFVDEMKILSERLDQAAQANEIVNLQDLFFRFTLDGFCRIGFGETIDSLRDAKPIPFATAFDDAQTRLSSRFLTPLWPLVEFITPIGWRHARNVRIIQSFGQKIVEKRLSQIQSGADPSQFSDALSFMMSTEMPATGKPPSPSQLVEYVVNLIIAGRDTTAQALSWCVLMLHRNPAAKAALLAEIDAALPDRSQLPTYEQVRGLTYANAVFHETLRLYPSVPQEIKQAAQDDVLPNGLHVPAGTLVSWSPYAMGRNTLLWGEDAASFRPERWLEMDKAPSQFVYPVFNAGPRVCLGKNMAELEGVFVLVSLLRQFDVQVLHHEKVTYAFSLTLPMKNGMDVRVTRRE